MKTQAVLIAAVAVVLAVVVDGRRAEASAVPAVLRARMFEVVDARGVRRASLKVERDGAVLLRLFDETGTIRVKLGAGKDGSGLLLADETTEPGLHLLATDHGTWVALQRGEQRRVLTP